jgi:hypothetical protein
MNNDINKLTGEPVCGAAQIGDRVRYAGRPGHRMLDAGL